MEKNRIINGECIEELKKIEDNSIDLIFADPPYWMRFEKPLNRVEGTVFDGANDEWDKFNTLEEYEDFTEQWLKECQRVLKKDGSIWVIGGMQCIYTIGAIMQRIGFWLINDVIWHKSNPTPNFRGVKLTSSHETLIWATKNKKSRYTFNYKTAKELNDNIDGFDKGKRKQLGSIWKFPVCGGNERLKDEDGNKLHNTQKPERLLYQIIISTSKVGDVILDPFAGTMTTGKVAKQTGRNYIMIERDEKYYKYGKRRIEETETVIGNLEKATFDIKPPKVTMAQMIKDNYLIEGEEFYLKNKEHEKVTLAKNGKIILSNGEQMSIHKGAIFIGEKNIKSINGFEHWYVKRNGKFVLIYDIREQYRKDFYGWEL